MSYCEVKELGDQGRYQKLKEIALSYLSPSKTRKYAVRELGKKPEEFMETLIDLLDDCEYEVINEAIKGLQKKQKVERHYDEFIVFKLAGILKTDFANAVAQEAFKLLNRIDEGIRVVLLVNVFDETNNEDLLDELVLNFANLKGAKANNKAKKFMEAYIKNNGDNKKWAVKALGSLQAHDKILLLRSIVKDKNEDIDTRRAALFALELIEDGRALGIILRAIEDKDLEELTREVVPAWALDCGYKDKKAMKEDLNSEEEDLYLSAVFALDYKNYLENPELLLPYLEDDNSEVRAIAEAKVNFLGEEVGEEIVKKYFSKRY